MEGNVQQVVKQVSKFDGKNADDFLEPEEKLLNEEQKWHYQAITGGAVMYLAQVACYDIFYAGNQLARALS